MSKHDAALILRKTSIAEEAMRRAEERVAQDIADTLIEIGDSTDYELGEAKDAQKASAQDPSKWGGTLTVPQVAVQSVSGDFIIGATTLSAPSDTLQCPPTLEEFDCTIVINPNNVPSSGYLIAFIHYNIGTALYQVKMYLANAGHRMLQRTGKNFAIYCYVINPSGSASNLTVKVGFMRGHARNNMFYSWNFSPTPLDGVAAGSIWQGQAILGGVSAVMTAAGPASPAAPLYLLGFDSIAAPAGGATPIPGMVSGPLVGVGSTVFMGDDTAPGAIGWTKGLYLALSTTTGTYTAPVAGATIHADVKIGT